MSDDDRQGIWLEVIDVRYETGPSKDKEGTHKSEASGQSTDGQSTDKGEPQPKKTCSVLLKGDREHPKPVWWPVAPNALGITGEDPELKTSKFISEQLDKKRLVLTRLSCNPEAGGSLHCMFFRFQSADSVSR